MKKILLVYLPFCTPVMPPYSIANLYGFLRNNCDESEVDIDVLNLNLEFHKLKFPEYQSFSRDISRWKDYERVAAEYCKVSKKTYSKNNKLVVEGEKPEHFDEMLQMIITKKPDIVAFSIVYSSQAFYAYSLLKELKALKGKKEIGSIVTIIGGPAVNEKLVKVADKSLKNEVELLEYIKGRMGQKIEHSKLNMDYVPDYSVYDLDEYFTPEPVIPIKTTSNCFYRGCTFCSHYTQTPYFEFPLELLRDTIIASKQKYFFFIDDMLHTKRLLEIADVVRPLNIKWTCQLRPTKELDSETLKILKDSGLSMVIWGVESGCDRILKLMNKGTNKSDIQKVLVDSHKAGIKNVVYIIFGFPTETKQEFLETIELLKNNDENIDLVSTSVFGLQKGTPICNEPEKYGIRRIIEKQRTVLEPSISYDLVVSNTGLSHEQAVELRNKYKKTIEKINKYPKSMNFFREHMFCIINQES